MVKIGMMIGDRYEILEKIGTGGTSDVYKAKCHKLNRFVAVKVLKQEFSENTSFVQKFRTEAQAAAGLMHANIVNVYDVGEEGGIYYIVMELVEGITLKKYIEKKGRLSVKEAVSIAIQVSLGIEAAHNNHIIHRDIKPQNIIISKEGRVKVTDFGIAKAASSNTITSNVMGSVHYTSPEQARGGYSDAKSDIYSLGITLFEMLTGRVPFTGDTTVAIAIKHIQEEMPSPRQFVPDVPVSVEKIVLKCTQKVPDKRYLSMAELIEDLKKSLMTPDDDFVNMPEKSRSAVHTNTMTVEERNAANGNRETGAGIPGRETVKEVKPGSLASGTPVRNTGDRRPVPVRDEENVGGTRMWDAGQVSAKTPEYTQTVQEGHRIRTNQSSDGTNGGQQRTGKKTSGKPAGKRTAESEDRTERILTTAVVVIVILIALIVIYIFARMSGAFDKKGGNGTGTEIGSGSNSGNEQSNGPGGGQNGDMSGTDPSGKTGIEIHDVVGMMRSAAKVNLTEQGFKVDIVEIEDENVDFGHVISQNPEAGTRAELGTTVTITVSLGKVVEQVAIPVLLGRTEEEIVDVVEGAGLHLGEITYEYNDTYKEGLVCSFNYPADQVITVPKGTEINVVISLGPKTVMYYYDLYVTEPAGYKYDDAVVELVGNDGTVLYKAEAPVIFPLSAHIGNIRNISSGTIKVSYKVDGIAYDSNGYGYITYETKTVETPVSFTKE